MRILISLFILVVFLSLTACTAASPLPEGIQTAIQQTVSSKPTDTLTPEPTNTPTASATQISEPTSTPLPSPTLQPTHTSTPDPRVIIGKPEDYILEKNDLPDQYHLSPGWSTPHSNSEVISARGVEEGQAYVAATGRIGGWIIDYDLTESAAIAPEWIESYLVMYDSVNGSLLSVSPEWDWIDEEAEILDIPLDLGDWNRVTVIRERQSNGEYYIWYTIEFIYRNVWAEVMGGGMESDVCHEYIENAARVVLAKLEAAPLGTGKN